MSASRTEERQIWKRGEEVVCSDRKCQGGNCSNCFNILHKYYIDFDIIIYILGLIYIKSVTSFKNMYSLLINEVLVYIVS